uniref:AAA+ ATPase domain-containing protein n=1 Tax=Araucaria muelleri TaxID=56996 RepID=A0A0B5HBI2_9CONI|nr:hypothetical protein Ycf2 [Araucaria muelleri]
MKLKQHFWMLKSKNFRFHFRHRFRLEMMQVFNPWNKSYLTESYLFRFLTRIFSCRERPVKLFNFRILVTLLLRDLRSIGFNQTIKIVVLLTLPVFMYRANHFWNEKRYMMFIAPNFTRNLLMVPHLSVYLSKYDINLNTNINNNKNEIISENQGPITWETSKSEDSPIYWNFFEILSKASIYEPCMSTGATKKPIQSFKLLKRQQDDHPFQYFMESERNRRVDFWKVKTYFHNPSSIYMSSSDPGRNIIRKNQRDINYFNCIQFMHRSSLWDLSSSVCDQNKEQWKKILLEITDQFALSMAKSSQVDNNQFTFDVDYNMNQFYELNKSKLLNQIFKHKEKLKDQFLLSLLNIIDKENEFVDRIIKRNNNDRTETSVQLILIQYKMKVDGHFSKANLFFQKAFKKYRIENVFNKLDFRSGRNSKDPVQVNWIENESLNNVMQNTINQHSSSWRKGQKEWFNHSILRTDKYINRNFILYNWSTQTKYLKNGLKHLIYSSNFSSNFTRNYLKLRNRVFDLNEYRVLVPIDIRLPLKEFLQLFLFKNLSIFIDLFDNKVLISAHLPKLLSNWWSNFRSKLNINIIVDNRSSIIDFLMGDEDQYNTPRGMIIKEKRLALYNQLLDDLIRLFNFLNNLFEPLWNKLLKLIPPIIIKILDDSQRPELIDEGIIAQSVLNEIPMSQLIIDLLDNEKNCMEFVDNTDLSALFNDQNWLNPLKLSNQSLLRASFNKANTIEFFDYLHNPRLNYKRRLFSYMESIHIKKKNLAYGQLFNLFPIHNNLFSLPIDEKNPVLSEKEIVSLINSQVANILLPKYLHDQTLIYDLYKSVNLLTQLNSIVHDKRYISSIEEISTTPFRREQQIVNFEKTSCPPFFNNSDSEENNLYQYEKSVNLKDMDFIQTQSYQDDLRFIFETLFMEMNKKSVKKYSSTKSSKNIIENKATDFTSPWWKCFEDILLDTYMEIKKSSLLNKDKEIFSRVFQFQINSSKWDLFQTYRLCVFTSAWWKYLEDIFLYPFLQILINSRDQFASILDLFEYKNEFITHILDVLNILWALPQKLLALLEWKLRTNLEKFFNYVFNSVSYYVSKFSGYVSYYVFNFSNYVFYYVSEFFSNYASKHVSIIYHYFSGSKKKWRNWYFLVLSWVESFKKEKANQEQELEMMEIEIEIRNRGRKIPFTLFKEITFIPAFREFTFKEFKEMKMMERLKMMERFMIDVRNGLIKNEESWVLFLVSFVVGYFILRLFSFPFYMFNLTKDYYFWRNKIKYNSSYKELHHTFQPLVEPMPGIISGWFLDYEDYNIPIEEIYNYFIRKWSCIRELKKGSWFFFSIYTTLLETNYSSIDQRERELAHFLIKEKSFSQLELKLITNPKDFSFKRTFPVTDDPNIPVAGYITEQPGLIYLRYLAETYQQGIMNYTNRFDQFGSAERSVFLAFCNKITSLQKDCWGSLSSSQVNPHPLSLNLGPSSSYFSKRIFLIGPMNTGRSYLVKSLAADSYIPLVRISLRYFLPRGDDLKNEFEEKAEDPMLYAPSLFDDTAENKLDRIDMDMNILQKNLRLKRIQQFMLALELAKAMSPCIIWIPNIHELNFGSFFLSILVRRLFKENFPGIVIGSTHLPKKVDPFPIGSDGLDRSIHIRLLPFLQRQREFPILLRSKGVYLEKEWSCSDEFGFRTKGFNARDLTGFTNEIFLISINQKKSVIGTNTIRFAFSRTTTGLFGYEPRQQERLPYKVGKSFIQHTLNTLRSMGMDPLFVTDFWLPRAFYLSHWYLEPSIAEATVKQFTIFSHIMGCLAGSAAQDSWFISEQNKDNWRSLDGFIKNDFALASSLLESFLVEFSLGFDILYRGRPESEAILTFAGRSIVKNHFNMVERGISSLVNKESFRQEKDIFGAYKDQDEDDFLNRLVWAPRPWRLSFIRSNKFDILFRANHFVELLEQYYYYDILEFEYMKEKLGSLYKRSYQKYKTQNKWNAEIKARVQEQERQRIILGEFIDTEDYHMQYQSSKFSIFFLERFLWDPVGFVFQEKRISMFSHRELLLNEEMLKRIYITYIPIRKEATQNPFRSKYVLGVYSENKILNMKDWKLEDIIPGDHMVSVQRIQTFGFEWKQICPYTPSFTYGRWLVEVSPMVIRLENMANDRQAETTRWLSDYFTYHFLFESYQYLLNLFQSNRMLLNQMTKTLLERRILFANEIRYLIAEEKNRNKRD